MTEQSPETTPSTPAAPEPQEAEQPTTTPEPDATDDGSPEEPESAWDPERARQKIRKINSENKALRERAAQAEAQAASVPDLQAQTQTLGSENLRLRVGYELGLPLNLAMRLQGATRDEMVTDAESLVELIAPQKSAAPAPTRPVESLRPGASVTAITPPEDDSYPSHWLPQQRA